MKYIPTHKFGYLAVSLLSIGVFVALPVSALTSKSATSTSSSSSAAATAAATALAAAQQAHVQRIITRGNNEINRRLTTLGTLQSKISASTKLTSADAATLSGNVNADIAQLKTLETKLDSDTTVADASVDAQSIITDYRVYVLVVPQVNLVKAADDEQMSETQLSTLAAKLKVRISSESSGVNPTLSADLTSMQTSIVTAQGISSNIESTVIGLTPSDYNANPAILSGDRNQLISAQYDIIAAIKEGTAIIAGLPASSSNT
jgi:hypothetical protein